MFPTRSYQKELLDRESIPAEDLYRNLEELDFINTWLGGHAITLSGLKDTIKDLPMNRVITIADIGCGGGDNLKFLAKWARTQKITLKFYGIDLKEECIDFARRNCSEYPEITFVQSDYRHIKEQFDIIASALFCHHLNDGQLVEYLTWCKKQSCVAFFINDLQRHYLAYMSIKLLTRLFSRSYLVKNDAPLSVKRGFYRKELQDSCLEANTQPATIKWKWAFRYLLIYRHST